MGRRRVLRLSSDSKDIEAALRCVLCKKFPNPDYLMVCEKNHYLCGRCAWTLNHAESEEREKCCESENLKKRRCPVLETFLGLSGWTCINKQKGCNAVVMGVDLISHWRLCRTQLPVGLNCRFKGCTEALDGESNTIFHLTNVHGIERLKFDGPKQEEFVFKFEVSWSLGDYIRRKQFVIVTVGKETFVVVGRLLENIVYFWLWDLKCMKANSESSKAYILSIKTANELELLQYRGICIPYWKSSEQVIGDGDYCLALPVGYVIKKKLVITRISTTMSQTSSKSN